MKKLVLMSPRIFIVIEHRYELFCDLSYRSTRGVVIWRKFFCVIIQLNYGSNVFIYVSNRTRHKIKRLLLFNFSKLTFPEFSDSFSLSALVMFSTHVYKDCTKKFEVSNLNTTWNQQILILFYISIL